MSFHGLPVTGDTFLSHSLHIPAASRACLYPSLLPKSSTPMHTQHFKLSFLAQREDFKLRLCVGVTQGGTHCQSHVDTRGPGCLQWLRVTAAASARLSGWDVGEFTGSGLSEPSPGAAGAPGKWGKCKCELPQGLFLLALAMFSCSTEQGYN